jgi:hypothetical protein
LKLKKPILSSNAEEFSGADGRGCGWSASIASNWETSASRERPKTALECARRGVWNALGAGVGTRSARKPEKRNARLRDKARPPV